ncbi:hypothetical protein MUN89_17820 [Halobacillus salinarum]|uniref:Uncharacterized protein n=1 Tax=Halobacillus salinarum TaxID=2932257 RepID=A0ABY4ENN8_9BACI|nr:hypothetical protein [Halobacillus salinarum]UOQ43721.1 hypothetical protein MUN89_17820 [Halobacillus salinarum]
MSYFQVFIVFSLLLKVIFSLVLSRRYQASLHHSQRMVISMVFGTSIGLVIGVTLGSIFQGDLFYSTLLGLSTGAFIGGICTCKLGLIYCIEGISAGLMSGMMGLC